MTHCNLVLSWLILVTTVTAFSPPTLLKPFTRWVDPKQQKKQHHSYRLYAAAYGLATPAGRILKEVVSTSKGQGYYRAREDEQVMDVIVQITEGNTGDVALVYTKDEEQDSNTGQALLGIFTETDYINVRHSSHRVHHVFIHLFTYMMLFVLYVHGLNIYKTIVFDATSQGIDIRNRISSIPTFTHFTICNTNIITHFHLTFDISHYCLDFDATIQRTTFNSSGYSHHRSSSTTHQSHRGGHQLARYHV